MSFLCLTVTVRNFDVDRQVDFVLIDLLVDRVCTVESLPSLDRGEPYDVDREVEVFVSLVADL